MITKCPNPTCVQAVNPPSGGGPGSFQLLLVVVLVMALATSLQLFFEFFRVISSFSPCGTFNPAGYASISPSANMDIGLGSKSRSRVGREDKLEEFVERASGPPKPSCLTNSTTVEPTCHVFVIPKRPIVNGRQLKVA